MRWADANAGVCGSMTERKTKIRRIALGIILFGLSSCYGSQYEIVIAGGLIIDGSGREGFFSDIAIDRGEIAFIGDASGVEAKKIIDATGLVVAPGFIDVHNHSVEDITEPFDWTNPAYITQGVTTIVAGPDGFLSPDDFTHIHEQLQRHGLGTNYAYYVGHNGIRRAVMGNANRQPTAAELDRMKELVREGMEMGGVGLSTGLMYEPGMFSDIHEVIQLAKEVEPFDGIYDSHTRDPVFHLLESDEEAIEIGRAAGIDVKIAHEKAVGLVNRGNIGKVIKLVEDARADGIQVYADQYPYDGAATAILESLIVLPELAEKGLIVDREELVSIVHESLARGVDHTILKENSELGINGGFSWIKAVGYGSIRIVDAPRGDLVDRNIELYAKELGQEAFDLVVNLVREYPGRIVVTLGSVNEEDVRSLLVQPWTMIGSDGHYVGSASSTFGHPRWTGSFPRVLGHYTRELGLLSLPEAIRKMTSLPADHLRLHDRGRLQVGKVADIVAFSAERINDRSTWVDPNILSEGVVHLIVNGVSVIEDGGITGATPGQFVKRQSNTRF